MNHMLFKAKSLANAKKNGGRTMDVNCEVVRDLTNFLSSSNQGGNDLWTLWKEKVLINDMLADEAERNPEKVEMLWVKCFIHYICEYEITQQDTEVISALMNSSEDKPFEEFLVSYQYMTDEEEEEFFRVCSTNMELRRCVADCTIQMIRNLDLTSKVFWGTYNGRLIYRFICKAIWYFPECIAATLQYALYSFGSPWKCEADAVERLLQAVVDSRYLDCDYEIHRRYIEEYAEEMVSNTMSLEVIWLLKEYFGVDSYSLYGIFEDIYDSEDKVNIEDIRRVYLKTKEGYQFVRDNWYRVVNRFPGLIFDISMDFHNDESKLRLMRVAEESIYSAK